MNFVNLKLAIRNLLRAPLFSFLNIAGLATGLAVAILIFNYAFQEFQADKQHNNLENVYVLLNENSAAIPYAMAPLLREQVSGIKNVSMVESCMKDMFILKYKDNRPIKSDVIFADGDFTKIFTFKQILGDLENALTTVGSVILTESESYRLFNHENPIGKIISLKGNMAFLGTSEVEVKAVIKDLPENSNLQFKAAVSYLTAEKMMPWTQRALWELWNVQNYVLLEKGQDPKILASKMSQQIKPLIPEKSLFKCNFSLLPYRNAYFSTIDDHGKHGNLKLVYTLGSIALLVLLIAAINYINLSMAGSVKRLTEVGVKKIVGVKPVQVIIQFLSESILISFIAMILGLFLAWMVTPSINKFFPIHLPEIPLFTGSFWLIFTGCSIIIGIAAGLLPALSFNQFGPISLIAGRSKSQNRGVNLKGGLIVFQFIVSIVLIICTITVTRQLGYLKNSDMGFNSENIVNIKLSPEVKPAIFKDKFQHIPGIEAVSFSLGFPGNILEHRRTHLVFKGVDKVVDFAAEYADASYVDLMGLKIAQGRNFSDSLKSDLGCALLNEAAVNAFELENPLDAVFQENGQTNKIIGVIKDYNFESLHSQVKPLVIFCGDQIPFGVNVKLSAGNFNTVSATIGSIEQIWKEVSPNYPIEIKFMDQVKENLYRSEIVFDKIFRCGSLFAIFISCLGLFGLVLGTAEQRKKEIGIRKVNGAKISQIMFILNKDIIRCVIIAFAVAAPIAWYLMHRWIENFAYKISLSWWIFALSGVLALGIALLTVGWQSWKAATRNPVEALRYE